MMREKSCLPVQSGLGFRMAGWGIRPSQMGRNIRRFIISDCNKPRILIHTEIESLFRTKYIKIETSVTNTT